MPEILVSVLMTAYNRKAFIAEAIESVLHSTYKNFELIILDDCSSDNTVAIAKQYEKDERVKVFQNERNLGQFENRNKAAALAKGTYLKYLDSDDILYPHSLEIMVDSMLKFPEAGIGVCEKYKDANRPYPFCLQPKEVLQTHYLQKELLLIGPSGTIIKKQAFEEANGFEDFGMPSDNHLTLKIASKHPVVMMQRDLFWWRVHQGQTFQQNRYNYNNILNNYRFNSDILLHYSPLAVTVTKKILFNQKKIFYRNILRLAFKKRKALQALALLKGYYKVQQGG